MDSKRLLNIASLISKDDKVIDVGCDHGYLGIYLKENDLVSDLLLTDINNNALNNAINNIKNHNLEIPTKLTDGIIGIDLDKYNTITISGMGTYTIKNILSSLDNNSSIKKIVIQSNNNLDELRLFLNNIGFYLKDEITIQENNIYYVIGLYERNNKNNSLLEIKYGILKDDKINYYEYLINTNKNILNNVPSSNKDKINELNQVILDLEELLKKCR